ncbi:unnamed protein product [Agarophyton chilense]|eukprot:gb/GEZJ01002819.1/.p1 GENE.gb/GEZJ01002819.1/~~gb/GEZJ01002819.1/.p1  ORF type:complete len:909 (+),score=95.08 gb/GEZJ01002819.1/:1527-4253(+)
MRFSTRWRHDGDDGDEGDEGGVGNELAVYIERHQHRYTLAESFCLPSHQLTVLLDRVPVRAAHISISPVPPCGQQPHVPAALPLRLHYGCATSSATWLAPRDASFDALAHQSFVAELHIPQQCVVGISFVIQLRDGSWLKDDDGTDFYVGVNHRRSPACVEVPLACPQSPRDVQQSRLTSLYKQSPFWIAPEMHKKLQHSANRSPFDILCDVMHETVFALIETKHQPHHQTVAQTKPSHVRTTYTALVFVADAQRALRTTLFSTGTYPAIRIESGKRRPLSISHVTNALTCFMHSSPDAFATIANAIEHASRRIDHFCSRRQKLKSSAWPQFMSKHQPLLHSLGFCTWDAFGHNVTQENVLQSFQCFQSTGIRLGYIILDDGWQAGGANGPNFEHSQADGRNTHRPCIASFGPNNKFDRSLEVLQNRISVPLLAWTAAIGYWGGTDGKACNVKTCIVNGVVSKGLLKNDIGNPRQWEKRYEVPVPTEQNVQAFLHSYFVKSLAATQKLSGLKIDAQSILEVLHDVDDGDAYECHDSYSNSLTALYRGAITKAVSEGFPQSIVVNSMACGLEAIFASGSTLSPANICWRISDDHAFPNTDENAGMVAWHVLRNAMNTLLLGEIFPVSDWDMFTAHHKLAKVHAISRVLSGGPICISDAPHSLGTEELALLKSLLTSDGKILRCEEPGRPVLDCIFEDPRRVPVKLFKVFNRSSVSGVIGVFNLDENTKNSNTSGSFAPCDVYAFSQVSGDVSYLSMIAGRSTKLFYHRNQFDPCFVQLAPLDALIAHVSPVLNISAEMQFAAIGNARLLNTGAVIASIAISRGTQYKCIHDKQPLPYWTASVSVTVSLRDSGETAFWLNESARRRLKHLMHADTIVDQFRYAMISGFYILFVTIPSSEPYEVQFFFEEP